MSWVVCAVLSAVFAALTSILSKAGLQSVPSNLAVAIRTIVVLVMAWLMVWISGQQRGLSDITGRSLMFLIASGIATGLSWLFYFRAIQLGPVSKVVPIDKLSVVIAMVLAAIFLGEKLDAKAITGGILILAGTLVMVL